ncbi:MAG: hypothetical protein ACPGES_07690 [Coraliomargarita sp.]
MALSSANLAAQEMDAATLSKKAANPLGDVWLMWGQHDTVWYDGDVIDGSEVQHITSFRPLLSFPFKVDDEDWNLVLRPALQYVSNPVDKDAADLFGATPDQIQSNPDLLNLAQDPFDGRTSGLGDTVLMGLVGPNRLDGTIWGVGATTLWPTASEDVLGSEQFAAGPAVLWANLGKEPGDWNIGFLAQHWESYAGDDDRSDVSLTDVQYFINYKVNDTDLIGMSPNIRYNWEADSSDEALTLPIGLGYNTMIFIGKMPVRIGVEAQYMLISPDSVGQDWGMRLYFIPILPNPFK